MRSEAYKLSGFTLVAGAVGFLLRWLQDLRIVGEDGLADNAPISWLVAGVIVLAAAAVKVYMLHLRQYDAPDQAKEALAGHTPFYGAISLLPAVLLAMGGLLQVVKPGDTVLWPTMHRICGGMMVLGAFGAAILAMNMTKEGQERLCRTGVWLMLAFTVYWLITGYRDAASDPVVWRFVVGILTRCAMLLGIYYVAGFFFNAPHPRQAVLACNFAAFLCIMTAVDGSTLSGEHVDLGSLAQSVAYVAMAMQFLIWAFVITENFKTKPLTPAGQEKK